MGRRARNRHWSIGEEPDTIHTGRVKKIALCGTDSIFAYFNTDRLAVDCPKCAAALAAEDLAAYHADSTNPRLELRSVEKDSPAYRFAYRATIGGEHVGYVVYDGAYGNGDWYITEISVDDDGSFKTGGQLEREDGIATRSRWRDRGHPYGAKDRALLAIPGLVQKRRLRSIDTIKRDQAAWQEQRARNSALHQAREAEEAERLREALDALSEIRDLVGLSNYQRNGIEYAIQKLKRREP